jgi:hypothetical protein
MGSKSIEPAILARRNFGGYILIFTPFCKTAEGKSGEG